MITVTVLGAGQYYFTPGETDFYNSTGNVIATETTTLILDLGRGCLRTFIEQGYSIHQIDALCITHTHPDHVADALALLQAHFLEYKKMPERRGKQLQIVGPQGIKAWFDLQLQLLGDDPPYYPVIHEQPEQLTLGDVTIHTALLQHVIPDIGYRVGAQGKAIVYSGDTGATPALTTLAQEADLLMLECANDSKQVTPVHLTPEECGQIATAAQVKQLVLTHYGARHRQVPLSVATQQHFSGILKLAETGQRLCMS